MLYLVKQIANDVFRIKKLLELKFLDDEKLKLEMIKILKEMRREDDEKI